jgi:hypothetical protein
LLQPITKFMKTDCISLLHIKTTKTERLHIFRILRNYIAHQPPKKRNTLKRCDLYAFNDKYTYNTIVPTLTEIIDPFDER